MLAAVVTASGAAAAIDLRTGRIPEPADGAGRHHRVSRWRASACRGTRWQAPWSGALLGFALMLPGHILGGTGAGDVKLLAALGTLLGPGGVVMAFLYSAIAGGLLAVGHALERRRLGTTSPGPRAWWRRRRRRRRRSMGRPGASRFAYGPALAVGAIAAALLVKMRTRP